MSSLGSRNRRWGQVSIRWVIGPWIWGAGPNEAWREPLTNRLRWRFSFYWGPCVLTWDNEGYGVPVDAVAMIHSVMIFRERMIARGYPLD